MNNKLLIIAIATYGLINFNRLSKVKKRLDDLEKSHLGNINSEILSLQVRLEAINDLINADVDSFIAQMTELGIAVSEFNIGELLIKLQEAKQNALLAIAAAENAYNFFNAPVELTEYVRMTSGRYEFVKDFVPSNIHIATSPGISALKTSGSPRVTVSRTGTGLELVSVSIQTKQVFNSTNVELRANTVVGTMSFAEHGGLFIKGNYSTNDVKYLLQFNRSQARQVLNAREIIRGRTSSLFYESGPYNLYAERQEKINGARPTHVVSVGQPGGNKDFTIRVLSDSLAEITAHPTTITSGSASGYLTLSPRDASKRIHATITTEVLENALFVPLSLCEIADIRYFISGVPSSSSGDKSKIL